MEGYTCWGCEGRRGTPVIVVWLGGRHLLLEGGTCYWYTGVQLKEDTCYWCTAGGGGDTWYGVLLGTPVMVYTCYGVLLGTPVMVYCWGHLLWCTAGTPAMWGGGHLLWCTAGDTCYGVQLGGDTCYGVLGAVWHSKVTPVSGVGGALWRWRRTPERDAVWERYAVWHWRGAEYAMQYGWRGTPVRGEYGTRYGWRGTPVRGEWYAVWLEGDTC